MRLAELVIFGMLTAVAIYGCFWRDPLGQLSLRTKGRFYLGGWKGLERKAPPTGTAARRHSTVVLSLNGVFIFRLQKSVDQS